MYFKCLKTDGCTVLTLIHIFFILTVKIQEVLFSSKMKIQQKSF